MRKFPEKPKTREPGEIIVECTSYFIPFLHARAITKRLVLGFHTHPIILMGFIPVHIGHMDFLIIQAIPSIMVYIVSTAVEIR